MSHELLYFDGAGRAEAIRILLHIGKVDFTDTRFKGEDWPTIKPTTPLGFVPVLKIDDVSHCQSMALLRYAGKLAGWYPTDPIESLIVDEVLDTLNELMSGVPRKATHANGDEGKYKELRQEYQNTTLKHCLRFVENFIITNAKKNPQSKGVYIVGNSPTIADLALSMTHKSIAGGDWDHISPTVFVDYPLIVQAVTAVNTDAGIKSYYDSKK